MPRRSLPLAALVLAGALLGASLLGERGRDPGTGTAGDRAGTRARVVRVVDGDTVRVRLDGREEPLRYIGIDTPETKRPNTPVQCFGRRADERNRRLVADRSVRLRFDVERRDRYGRLLAYVYREPDGLFVNAALLREGYAQPLTVPPNVAHGREFSRLAGQARRAGRGLWSAC